MNIMSKIDFYPMVPKIEYKPYNSVEFQSKNIVNNKTNNDNNISKNDVLMPTVKQYPIVQIQSLPEQSFVVPQNIALSYKNKVGNNPSFVYGVIGAVVSILVIGGGFLLRNTSLRQKVSSWWKKTSEIKKSYHPNIVLDNPTDIREYRKNVASNLANNKRYKNDLKCIDIFTGNKSPEETKEILMDVYEIAKTISYSNYKTPKVSILLKQDAGILNLTSIDASLDDFDVDILKNGVLGKIKQIKLGFVSKDNDYTAYTKATISQNKNETNYSLNITRAIRRFFASFSD